MINTGKKKEKEVHLAAFIDNEKLSAVRSLMKMGRWQSGVTSIGGKNGKGRLAIANSASWGSHITKIALALDSVSVRKQQSHVFPTERFVEELKRLGGKTDVFLRVQEDGVFLQSVVNETAGIVPFYSGDDRQEKTRLEKVGELEETLMSFVFDFVKGIASKDNYQHGSMSETVGPVLLSNGEIIVTNGIRMIVADVKKFKMPKLKNAAPVPLYREVLEALRRFKVESIDVFANPPTTKGMVPLNFAFKGNGLLVACGTGQAVEGSPIDKPRQVPVRTCFTVKRKAFLTDEFKEVLKTRSRQKHDQDEDEKALIVFDLRKAEAGKERMIVKAVEPEGPEGKELEKVLAKCKIKFSGDARIKVGVRGSFIEDLLRLSTEERITFTCHGSDFTNMFSCSVTHSSEIPITYYSMLAIYNEDPEKMEYDRKCEEERQREAEEQKKREDKATKKKKAKKKEEPKGEEAKSKSKSKGKKSDSWEEV